MSTISVVKRQTVVKYRANTVIQLTPVLTPYTFTATEGQRVFQFNSAPSQVISLAVNGIMQSEANGDFTLTEKTITLAQGVNAGDLVFGLYAEQYTPLLKNFFFTATEGQTEFELTTTPETVYMLSVNGVTQNVLEGDYTIVGKIITLATPVNAGDKVFGTYHE